MNESDDHDNKGNDDDNSDDKCNDSSKDIADNGDNSEIVTMESERRLQ